MKPFAIVLHIRSTDENYNTQENPLICVSFNVIIYQDKVTEAYAAHLIKEDIQNNTGKYLKYIPEMCSSWVITHIDAHENIIQVL